MEIEFQGQYEKQQYFKAIYLAGKPSKRSTILRILLFLGFTGLLIGLAVVTMRDSEVTGYEISKIFRHLFTVLVLAYFIFQPYIKIYTTANCLWRDPLIRRKITGSVSNQGISYGTYYNQEWDSFIIKRETKDMVVFLTADRTMSLFPRHFFKDDRGL
ncbi:MAG: hypothetical protein GY845_35500, partial [Planctomycetes bacterium]|nr:hypothetical protein [Planctomycetota bacterium]